MGHSLRYAWHRLRRLTPAGAAAAAWRHGGALGRRLGAEARARLFDTRVEGQALQAALAADPGPGAPVGFFVEPARTEVLVARIRAKHADSIAATREAAEAVLRHRFDLLGSGPTDLGPGIDWHRDFKSGYRWPPRRFYARVRYGDAPGVDVKVPWELSRLQHLPTLGKAFWLTEDPRYAEEACRQVEDWMGANPPQLGVNWACTMDVAIRAVNLLWAWAFFAAPLAAAPRLRRQLLGTLVAHGRHILRNLERGADGITSNHYLADVTGLAALGLCCPDLREAGAWAEVGVREVLLEMAREVHPDGADFESSIPYHRLVCEMFLAVAILLRRRGAALPGEFTERLTRMLDFTVAYTKPNGLAPQVGDADDGRLHILADYGAWEPRDHRHLLGTGGALLGRGDLWAAAGPQTEEALWLVGDEPLPTAAAQGKSAAFRDAGIFILRHRDLYCLVSCGPVGTRGIGNHKHNDLLGLELQAREEDLLVDPGSYLYTPAPEWRNRFRSTAAHSTVVVDGEEQNRFGESGLFWLHDDARPRNVCWESSDTMDRFSGEHDGYRRLPDPVIHRREVRLAKTARRVEIIDELEGRERHHLRWTFVLGPTIRLRAASPDAWELVGERVRARLGVAKVVPAASRAALRATVEEAWVSPRYGVKEKSSALRFDATMALPIRCQFGLEIS